MEQVLRAIKGINQTDIVVAFVSAAACAGALLQLPVWAVFIGWAWYLAIGANGKAIKEGTVTTVAAGLMAITAVVLTDVLSEIMPGLAANMSAVFVMILVLMVSLKLSFINHSLVGFNTFSCVFAGYYLGAFPTQPDYWLNLGYAFAYICGSNVLGLIVGCLAQKLCNLSWRRESAEEIAAN
ncbi:DUF1097 domain-containing protein [Selenomonas ruminantium]|uniref:DUF1097 domain-containing protein n=1 Tax=Selenomonas ruminantium TaxID=971 RepID=A0A1H0RVN7_SELRU|nr:DUF1097 domain-containing protein [Selenomonas ruminantium]SDP33473.1 Protein of unknown function [Selenomonas ruminantium]